MNPLCIPHQWQSTPMFLKSDTCRSPWHSRYTRTLLEWGSLQTFSSQTTAKCHCSAGAASVAVHYMYKRHITKLTRKFCTLMKVTWPTAYMRWPHTLEIHTHQRLAITCSSVPMYSTFTHVYYANCRAICYAYVPMIVSACVRSSCTTAPALWYSFTV